MNGNPVNYTDPTGHMAFNNANTGWVTENTRYYDTSGDTAGLSGAQWPSSNSISVYNWNSPGTAQNLGSFAGQDEQGFGSDNFMFAGGVGVAGVGSAATGVSAGELLGAGTRAAAGSGIGALLLPLTLSGDTRQDRTQVYVTYERTNPSTGQVYSGRTSGYADEPIDTILNRRAAGQPLLNSEGFNKPVVDAVSTNYGAIRGREQQLIDSNGGAQSVGGTARNKINGIRYCRHEIASTGRGSEFVRPR